MHDSTISIRPNYTVDGHDADIDFDLVQSGVIKLNSVVEVHCLCLASAPAPQTTFNMTTRQNVVLPMRRRWSILMKQLEGDTFERIGSLTSDLEMNGESECDVTAQDKIIRLL